MLDNIFHTGLCTAAVAALLAVCSVNFVAAKPAMTVVELPKVVIVAHALPRDAMVVADAK